MTIDVALVTPVVAIQAQPQPGDDVWSGWGSVIFVTAIVVLVLIVIGIVVWQLFKTFQTRMTTQAVIAQDEAYRKLAEQATATQEAIAADVARINAELTELRNRLTTIETILREVD